MDYRLILHPDLQDLLNKYKEIRDKFSALCTFSEQQQKFLEFERKQSEKMKNKLKNMLCWFMKREDQYKANLNSLEKKNKELNSSLADAQHELDHTELLNNKVSKLQDEIDLLRAQIVQVKNNHKQQLMLQNKSHEDEISKYKRLLENINTKPLLEQNVIKKDKYKDVKKHPALINEENRKRKGKQYDKLPGLKDDKVVLRCKRRRLYQDDKEVNDIV